MGNSKSKEEVNILEGKHYQKSNALVNAKGRANLIVQKLLVVGIAQAVEDEKTGILSATIKGTELRKIFGKKNGSFYDQIKKVIEPVKGKPSILDYRIIYTDDTTKKVEGINIVMDCTFENGIFTMRFNNKVNNQIHELKANYTVFSLAEAMPLKHVYSFKLYEILKAEYDKQDYIAIKTKTKTEDNPIYTVDIDLVDLKLRLGIISINSDEEITKELKKPNPDYEDIDKMASTQKDYIKYQDFAAFRRAALDKPQKELKENTSICFDYEPIRAGRGGKTKAVRFFIQKNNKGIAVENEIAEVPEIQLTEDEKLEILFSIKSLLGSDYSMKDVRTIAEKANYDYDKVYNAYDVMCSNRGKIDNVVGWLIDAMENKYEKPKTRKAKNTFINFEQREENISELEMLLLDN